MTGLVRTGLDRQLAGCVFLTFTKILKSAFLCLYKYEWINGSTRVVIFVCVCMYVCIYICIYVRMHVIKP